MAFAATDVVYYENFARIGKNNILILLLFSIRYHWLLEKNLIYWKCDLAVQTNQDLKNNIILLYKQQWNTGCAFTRKHDIFMHENNMLSSHVKRSPWLCLHNESGLCVGKYFICHLLSLVKYFSTLKEKFCIPAGVCDILCLWMILLRRRRQLVRSDQSSDKKINNKLWTNGFIIYISREAEVGVADGDNTESNVHISVLGTDQTLDIFKCTDPACEHFCTKTNKRYHCPLCNNKPQKPGRMRRHFEKMHSGKQIVQHGGETLGSKYCRSVKIMVLHKLIRVTVKILQSWHVEQ